MTSQVVSVFTKAMDQPPDSFSVTVLALLRGLWSDFSGEVMRLSLFLPPVQYLLQRSSPWRSVGFRWQTWLVLITALVLLGLVPYVVHRMMTAFTNPPPPGTFQLAAASFGVLTEILLIKWVFYLFISHLFRFRAASFGILMSHMMITVSDETNNISKSHATYTTRSSERPRPWHINLWKTRRCPTPDTSPTSLVFSSSHFDIANWTDACGTVNH